MTDNIKKSLIEICNLIKFLQNADSNPARKTNRAIILNRLLYNKKIPTIPHLLVDGKFVSDLEKANIFNNFFTSISAPIDDASCLLSFSHITGRQQD